MVFGMINDTCNLPGEERALLRLGEGNCTALGERVGGPHPLCGNPLALSRCAAMPLRD